eukprot:ANDGO_06563.mRNA.1 hypothetical protein
MSVDETARGHFLNGEFSRVVTILQPLCASTELLLDENCQLVFFHRCRLLCDALKNTSQDSWLLFTEDLVSRFPKEPEAHVLRIECLLHNRMFDEGRVASKMAASMFPDCTALQHLSMVSKTSSFHRGIADWREADERVFSKECTLYEHTIEDLSRYLAEPFLSSSRPLLIIRCFYRWITDRISYDCEAFLQKEFRSSSTPSGVFKTRKAVCAGYATLFEKMCQIVGIACSIVVGFASVFGVPRSPGKPNHAWNVVEVNGKWYLLDCCWGAGYATSLGKDMHFVKRFTEFYWLSKPELLISSHFPCESRWQLLDRLVSAEEFEAMVDLFPPAIDVGLSLVSHQQRKIKLHCNEEARIKFAVRCKLWATFSKPDAKSPFLFQYGHDSCELLITPLEKNLSSMLIFVQPENSDDTTFQFALSYDLDISDGGGVNEVSEKRHYVEAYYPCRFRIWPTSPCLPSGEKCIITVHLPLSHSVLALNGTHSCFKLVKEDDDGWGTYEVERDMVAGKCWISLKDSALSADLKTLAVYDVKSIP